MAEINYKHLTREQYRNSVQSNAKHNFTCMCCGVAAKRDLSSTNVKKGYFNKYCSRACKAVAYERIRKEIFFLRGLAVRRKSTAVSEAQAIRDKTRSVKVLAKAIAVLALRQSRASRPCPICGKAVGHSLTRPKDFCSNKCRRQTDAHKASHRAAKSRREAIERGCKEARSIDPIKVLERDGWKCQICGVSTPQRLRGTYSRRAPELDHVVPISKGGLHTWSNLQCACRECNGAKSNKSCAGQVGMFTALL